MLYKVVSTKKKHRLLKIGTVFFYYVCHPLRQPRGKNDPRPEREVIQNLANCLFLDKAHTGVVKNFQGNAASALLMNLRSPPRNSCTLRKAHKSTHMNRRHTAHLGHLWVGTIETRRTR